MLNDRMNELLVYLSTLAKVQDAGHYVNDEIKEVVREIRIELGLEKQKRDNTKKSLELVFEGKLRKRATFRQHCLFEAVFNVNEKQVDLPYLPNELDDMREAIDVLRGMSRNPQLSFVLTPDIVRIEK